MEIGATEWRSRRIFAVFDGKRGFGDASGGSLTPAGIGPRPVPAVPPVVEVVSVSGRQVKVRIRSATSESRGKPFGAIGANVYSYVGVAAPTDATAYHFVGMATRATADIAFPNTVASGATVWLSAQWVSARGELSFGSVPISVTLQGGLIPVAA